MTRYLVDAVVADTAAEAEWWFDAIEDARESARDAAADAYGVGWAPATVEPDPTYDPWEPAPSNP